MSQFKPKPSRGFTRTRNAVVARSVIGAGVVAATVTVAPATGTAAMAEPMQTSCTPAAGSTRCAYTEVVDFAKAREATSFGRAASSAERSSQSKEAEFLVPDTPEAHECWGIEEEIKAPNRFLTCNSGGAHVQTVEYVEGVPVPTGDAWFGILEYAKFSLESNSWTHKVWMDFNGGWGDAVRYNVKVESLCGTAGANYSSLCSTPDTFMLDMPARTPEGTRIPGTFVETLLSQPPGAYIKEVTADLGVLISTTIGPDYVPSVSLIRAQGTPGSGGVGLTGRCDARRLNETSLSTGCVNHKFMPTMVFDARTDPDLLEPAVRHIYDSQKNLAPHWGIPTFDNPLTRTEDTAKKNLNRAVACPSGLTRPTGTQCDEFPFASTNQGAAAWGADAIDVDWSRRFIDEDSNGAGGQIILDTYNNNRIREGDKFLVKSILPDGSASW